MSPGVDHQTALGQDLAAAAEGAALPAHGPGHGNAARTVQGAAEDAERVRGEGRHQRECAAVRRLDLAYLRRSQDRQRPTPNDKGALTAVDAVDGVAPGIMVDENAAGRAVQEDVVGRAGQTVVPVAGVTPGAARRPDPEVIGEQNAVFQRFDDQTPERRRPGRLADDPPGTAGLTSPPPPPAGRKSHRRTPLLQSRRVPNQRTAARPSNAQEPYGCGRPKYSGEATTAAITSASLAPPWRRATQEADS